jgi:hypothetical protein
MFDDFMRFASGQYGVIERYTKLVFLFAVTLSGLTTAIAVWNALPKHVKPRDN